MCRSGADRTGRRAPDTVRGRAVERKRESARRSRRTADGSSPPGAVPGDGAADRAEIGTVNPPERGPGTQSWPWLGTG